MNKMQFGIVLQVLGLIVILIQVLFVNHLDVGKDLTFAYRSGELMGFGLGSFGIGTTLKYFVK